MAPTSSPFAPWDGDREQAVALASLLRRVGGTAGVHIYELEALADGAYRCRVWIGQAVESLLGGIPPGMDAEAAWEHCVHADDRAAYDDTWQRMCAGEHTQLEYRMVGFDGRVRWLWERCTPRVADDGTRLVVLMENRDGGERYPWLIPGFDVVQDKITDMTEAGILDPLKVVRTALETGASTGVMALTTDALVLTAKRDPAINP